MSDHTPNSNYHPSRANATSTPRIPTYALHIELPRLTSCNCASDAFTQFSSIPAHDEEYCNAKWLCALGKNRGFSRLSSQFARSILQKRWKCFQEVSHARIFSTQNSHTMTLLLPDPSPGATCHSLRSSLDFDPTRCRELDAQ